MGHLGIRANLPALGDFVAAYVAGFHGRVLMMESADMAYGASEEIDGGDNLVPERGLHFCYSGHVQAHDLSSVCRGSTGMEIVVQVLYPVGRCMVIWEVQAMRVRGGMVFRDAVGRFGYLRGSGMAGSRSSVVWRSGGHVESSLGYLWRGRCAGGASRDYYW